MRSRCLAFLAALLGVAPALAAESPTPSARVLLVGDSTLARGSGYGDALCARFRPEVACANLAKGGRSSRSYRQEGSWTAVLEQLRAPDPAARYVLIQFGHNDQPGHDDRSTTLEQFTENMAGYVRDVRDAGATPVLVTPLTRRQFEAGKVVKDLEPWAEAVRKVAKEAGVVLLDLHRDSVSAVQALGPVRAGGLAEAPPSAAVVAAARTGNSIEVPKTARDAAGLRPAPRAEFDYTHLGPSGADLFADMVAREVRAALPPLAAFLSPKPPAPSAERPLVLDVWPAGVAPGGDAVSVKETVIERSTTPGLHDRALIGITRPTLTIYSPAKPDGSAVLILPGGAYLRVVIDKEGEETARRLNAHGITAAVLLYRLPADGWAAGRDAPLQDAQRALRLLRSGVAGPLDPARIGVLGFSAGGDLAAALSLRADGVTYARVDQADLVSARPDFSAFMYPALDMSVKPPDGKAPIPPRAPILGFVNQWSPPAFIAHAADDASVAVDQSLRLFSALKAVNVPAEMHIFSAGGHGFGVRLAAGKPVEAWPDLLVRWGQYHQFFKGPLSNAAGPAPGAPLPGKPATASAAARP
ncbi:MAG TPA: GDSL-type esterase/lipase family protein [Polyangiaceae bacterium]|nr:GDSL-type esterase/lipase family protein [Polyangiaceae bacterium]